jgi:hypothetical protein
MTAGPQFPLTKHEDFTGQMWDPARATEEVSRAINAIQHYLGQWYKWGGDTPDGFDCSGLACEYLKMLGVIARRSDFTAQGLCNIMPTHRSAPNFYPGDLVFFGASLSKITHVEICLSRYLAIGASGGGSNTLTMKDAIRDRAFIKVRPIIVGRGGNPLQLFGNIREAVRKVFASGLPLA